MPSSTLLVAAAAAAVITTASIPATTSTSTTRAPLLCSAVAHSFSQSFCVVAIGETSWDKPQHSHETSSPSPKKQKQKQSKKATSLRGNDEGSGPGLSDSAGDLSSLRRMRDEAAAKMAALR